MTVTFDATERFIFDTSSTLSLSDVTDIRQPDVQITNRVYPAGNRCQG